MAEVLAVRATITKIVAGYSVGMVIWARGRSRHLVGKTAVSLSEAEAVWPAPGSADTELGVLMEPEVGHGETDVYAGVQA